MTVEFTGWRLLLALAGVVLVVGGLWWAWPPAALILSGVFAVGVALSLEDDS